MMRSNSNALHADGPSANPPTISVYHHPLIEEATTSHLLMATARLSNVALSTLGLEDLGAVFDVASRSLSKRSHRNGGN